MDLISPEPRIGTEEILIFSCVRNERLRLPWFLEHHRKLGAERFIIVDNGSTDGTREYLQALPDVTLFETEESYASAGCGVAWINELLGRYAQGHWALILDADEQLIYPRCETLHLRTLVGYLESVGADCMRAPLLDMYSGTAIRDTDYKPGDPFLKACPFFDGHGYDRAGPTSGGHAVIERGGPRRRLFWDGYDRAHDSPFLPKVPLVKWRRGFALEMSTHLLRGARTAQATGILLHFKFLQDFPERARIERDRMEHFASARQYAAYAERLDADPALSAYHPDSFRYESSMQLVERGLMAMPPGFPGP